MADTTTKITIGLESLKGSATLPTASADLFTGTGYTDFGYVFKGTCKLTQEDGEETEYYAEELDDPVEVISRPGKTNLEWSILNPSLEVIKRIFGGTIATNVYAYPDAVATIEESIILTPRQGFIFHFPRVKINAKINGDFASGSQLLIECKATVLKHDTLQKVYIKEKP